MRLQLRHAFDRPQLLRVPVSPATAAHAERHPMLDGEDAPTLALYDAAGRVMPGYEALTPHYSASRRELFFELAFPDPPFRPAFGYEAEFRYRLGPAENPEAPEDPEVPGDDEEQEAEPLQVRRVTFDMVAQPLHIGVNHLDLWAMEPILAEHAHTRDAARSQAHIDHAAAQLLGRLIPHADPATFAPRSDLFRPALLETALALACRAIGEMARARLHESRASEALRRATLGPAPRGGGPGRSALGSDEAPRDGIEALNPLQILR